MKNVLLLAHDDAGEQARLQAALDLVRALSGHLSCVDVAQVPVLATADPISADWEVALLADVRQREAQNQARVQAQLEHEDVTWDWMNATGDIAPLLARGADLADIIVLNTRLAEPDLPDMMATVSDVVMHSGKPVLAVPEAARGLDVTGHVLIAWDGGAPVIETVRAITPLLELAEGVTLVEIGRISGPRAEDAAAYLSRHGISARVDRGPKLSMSVADTLLAACRQRSPAYCVMGAYGHSRLRENLFGGVTRRMLAESPVPLILGH